jgi:hypothetical protein
MTFFRQPVYHGENDIEADKGSPVIKSIEMPFQLLCIGRGCNRPSRNMDQA